MNPLPRLAISTEDATAWLTVWAPERLPDWIAKHSYEKRQVEAVVNRVRRRWDMEANGAEREFEIVEVRATDTKKDGSPLVTKTGKKMWSTHIQIAERPGIWISGLAFSDPSSWKGQKKKLKLFTEEFNGQQQPKFKVIEPYGGGQMGKKMEEMVIILKEIRDILREIRDIPGDFPGSAYSGSEEAKNNLGE